jgi:hypothetical protein
VRWEEKTGKCDISGAKIATNKVVSEYQARRTRARDLSSPYKARVRECGKLMMLAGRKYSAGLIDSLRRDSRCLNTPEAAHVSPSIHDLLAFEMLVAMLSI